MDVPRFPSFDELQLDPALRELILTKGGKAGVLEWLVKQDPSLPILRNTPLDNVTFREAKRLAKVCRVPVLCRSNNVCEYLPGTEGEFESIPVFEDDDSNDERNFSLLRTLPKNSMPHLASHWPKIKKDLRFAVVDLVLDAYNCNLIEHPNAENTFWITFRDRSGSHETLLSNLLDRNASNGIEKFNPRAVDEILHVARKVSLMHGLDSRYAKQMEFVFDRKQVYLTQAKVFVPRDIRPEPKTEVHPRKSLYRSLGVFDVEVPLYDQKTRFSALKEVPEIGLVLNSPKDVKHMGHGYMPNIKVAIFEWADGLLTHFDIPYLLHAKGIAVGDRSSYAIDDRNRSEIISLTSLAGKKVRLRSDGHYLYARPVES